MEEIKKKQIEEMLRKREEFKEQKKNALLFLETPPEKPTKKRGRKGDEYISDGSIPSGDENVEPRPRKKRVRREGEEGSRRRRGTRQGREGGRGRGRKFRDEGDDGLTAKQRRKIVSKETISSSEIGRASCRERV